MGIPGLLFLAHETLDRLPEIFGLQFSLVENEILRNFMDHFYSSFIDFGAVRDGTHVS